MEKQQNSVAIEYINVPVLILNGEIENVRSNIVYTVDDNGIKKLVTSEDDAKNLLYNYFNSSKEEQEILALNNPQECYRYCYDNKQIANIKAHQEIILSSKDAECCYFFAKNIKDPF